MNAGANPDSIHAACLDAQKRLALSLGVDTRAARFEAQLLLQHVLEVNRAWLISHETDRLPAPTHQAFVTLLARRLAGEPIAYILGKREFYGLDLRVTPDTLIPQPDTETLVEAALAKIPARLSPVDTGMAAGFSLLDLGTGSGAIALAIAHARPDVEVSAVDASAAALGVARHNAERLALDNIRFLSSDWFSAVADAAFDIIVSNPPYIAKDDPHLAQGDLRFEPLAALAAGPDGLDAIRSIVRQAPAHLKRAGWLLLEHGFDQADRVAELMRQAGFTHIAHAHDLAGIARVTLGQAPRVSPPDRCP